ncbi:unnamed protein product, partial [Musa acuminata var. zebrina]
TKEEHPPQVTKQIMCREREREREREICQSSFSMTMASVVCTDERGRSQRSATGEHRIKCQTETCHFVCVLRDRALLGGQCW